MENEEEQMRWVEQILTKIDIMMLPTTVFSFVLGVGHSDQVLEQC